MKVARFFSVIFAVLGTLLLVGSIVVCVFSLDAPAWIIEIPKQAVDCTDSFARNLNDGDLTAAAQLMYGQPNLGAEGTSADPETEIIWNAFLESISFEFTGKCYAADDGFARDASVTVLDISSVTQKLPERTQSLLKQRTASAQNMEEIYDNAGHFHEDLTKQVLQEAMQQALNQDAQTVIREVTVKLVNRDGKWWIVPDQTLLQAISGMA